MGRAKREGQWVQIDGWTAGRAWREPDGALTFHIRKQVRGRRYEVSTGASTLRAALKQLERFEADPDAYNPAGDPSAAPLALDNELAEAFLAWSLNDRGNTKPWVRKQQLVIAWWMERLGGVNLRRATLAADVLPHLERVSDRGTKIRVLKAFYSWLRKERHLVRAAQDPTYGALVAPQAKPAQWKKSKVVPREHFLLALEYLREQEQTRREEAAKRRQGNVVQLQREEPVLGPWADALHVQAGTGWHTSEVARFAASGSIEPLPKAMRVENGAAGVLVCPLHKSGDEHRTAVSSEVLEAGKRLRAHGSLSREWYDRAVRAACAAVKRPDGEVGIPVFTPGRLRHSTATWAIEAGASPAAVSAFLGHKSPVTTKRFYATHAVVPKVPTLV
jgi:integrase